MINIADIEIGAVYNLYYAGAEFRVVATKIWTMEHGPRMIELYFSGPDAVGSSISLNLNDFSRIATEAYPSARRTRIVEDQNGEPVVEYTPVTCGTPPLPTLPSLFEQLTSWVKRLVA